MSEFNWGDSKKPARSYKIDKPGSLGHSGPFKAEVMSTADPARLGRIAVWVRSFGDETRKYSPETWYIAQYMSPFYGVTQHDKIQAPDPNIDHNGHAYGFWMGQPDVGTEVVVMFIEGDPNQCYYIGCIPEPQMTHMIPAIGAQKNPHYNNDAQKSKCVDVPQVPVVEIDKKEKSMVDANYPTIAKPVHSYIAGQMWAQGLIRDVIRGPITSTVQRESPSRVYGFSTPGRPVNANGATDAELINQVRSGENTDTAFTGRKGGHSFTMDDGDINGNDQLVRLRTAGGHQFMLNDSGECVYFSHGSGKIWMEFGKEGTWDVFAMNSGNFRTMGEFNIHADKDININAGGNINMRAEKDITIEANQKMHLTGNKEFIAYSKILVGVKSDGTLHTDAGSSASFMSGSTTEVKASNIGLNQGFASQSVNAPAALAQTSFADTIMDSTYGWKSTDGQFKSVVTRAPTHEPYAEHGKGVTNVNQPK